MNRCLGAVLLVASAGSLPALGQDTTRAWIQSIDFELLLNEGLYSENWQGDEKTSGSVTTTLDHIAKKQLSGIVRFEHEAALASGQQLVQDTLAETGWEMSKSEDKVRFDEVLRFTLGAWVDPLASVQLKSQFVDSRDANRTRFLNPLQFLETMGAGRRFFDDSVRTLTSELGAAARQYLDQAADTTLVADAGVSWTTAYKTIVLTKNAGYATRLTMYKPLVSFSGGETGNLPQVDWEHELSARFNKVLSGKVYSQLLFDELVHKSPRLKQTLGLGLSLAWASK